MNKLSGLYLWAFIVLLTSFIAMTYGFGVYLFPILAPNMMKELKFTYSQMGVTTGAVQAGFLFFALASGFLTNIVGAFRVIITSIGLCALSLFGLIWANDFLLVSSLLIIMGGCAASVWVPMVEMSQQYIPDSYQGRALGLMSSGTGYGVFINSLLVVFLMDVYGWRSLWLATFFIALIICMLAFFMLRNIRHVSENTPLSNVELNHIEKNKVWAKIKKLPFNQTATLLFMMFLNGVSCMPFQTYLSSFLNNDHGSSVDESALAWRLIGLVGMIGGFSMGWLADRITVKWTLAIVYFFLSLSTAMILVFRGEIIELYAISILFGLAFYSIFGLVPAYISHVYKGGTAALVFAFGNVSLGLGGVFGNVLGGWLRAEHGNFQWSYTVVLAAALGTLIMSFLMKSEKQTANGEGSKLSEVHQC